VAADYRMRIVIVMFDAYVLVFFEKTVEHMDAEVKHCPSCGPANRAVVRHGMQSEL
jgi:hypothetical protein